MNTESKQPENDSSVIEELTAYLDGELDQNQMQQVELRLGEDTAYLAEMQSLQKTWDLLDMLPSTEPGTSFTKTTMELVVGEAVKTEKRRRSPIWVWPGRIAVFLALPALLFASAYGVIRVLQTEPDRILIENLGVIENHPRYDAIECDMDFLEKLMDLSLFSDTNMFVYDADSMIAIDEPTGPVLIPQSSAERKAYVDSLDVQKKLKLKRKFEDYQKKSDTELDRLNEFDAQLNQSENRARLTSTLNAYYDWLVKIEPRERSDLRDLSADERISAIIKIRNRQALDEFDKSGLTKIPSKEDAKIILEWCERIFQLNEGQIRNEFPAAFIQYAQDNNLKTPREDFLVRRTRHASLYSIVDFLIRADRQFVEDLVLDEMPLLYKMLSSKAQSLLDERSPDRQRFLILTWVEAANQSKRGISVEDLREFEAGLDVRDRDRLEKMSSDDYMATLKRMFIERRKSSTSTQDQWELELEEMLDSRGY